MVKISILPWHCASRLHARGGRKGSASISVRQENPNVPRSSKDKVPRCAARDFRISGQVFADTLFLCIEYLPKALFTGSETSKKLPLLFWHQRTPGSFIFNSVRYVRNFNATRSCNPLRGSDPPWCAST